AGWWTTARASVPASVASTARSDPAAAVEPGAGRAIGSAGSGGAGGGLQAASARHSAGSAQARIDTGRADTGRAQTWRRSFMANSAQPPGVGYGCCSPRPGAVNESGSRHGALFQDPAQQSAYDAAGDGARHLLAGGLDHPLAAFSSEQEFADRAAQPAF